MALRTVVGFMGGEAVENPADFFAPEFLARVDPTSLNAVLDEVRQAMTGGVAVLRVETGFGMDRIVGVVRATQPADQDERNAYRVLLTTDKSSGRIRSLFFEPAWHERLRSPGWESLDERIALLPGRVALGAYEVVPDMGERLRPQPVHTVNPQEPLPISDAARLAVAATVAGFIARSHRVAWEEEFSIQDRLKSLPPGPTRTAPQGSTASLARLVELALVQRDNSATDHLMDFVSRVGVENYLRPLLASPDATFPFLSTLEAFKIKLGEDEGLARRYAGMDITGRLVALDEGGEVFRAVPNEGRFRTWEGPIAVNDAGWFLSADDMGRLLADVARLTDRPGMEPLWNALARGQAPELDHRVWTRVGFVGGSEPGVLSMNWLLMRADGRRFALVLTWADAEARLPQGLGYMVAGAAARLLGSYQFMPPRPGGEAGGAPGDGAAPGQEPAR
jgi:hypothetical protein